MHQTATLTTDRELLLAYQRSGSPELFSQLVSRHVDLVYSVACRHVHEPNLAQDVTQEVFLTFFRKARTLDPHKPLVAWLFTTTRLVALQILRAEARRRRREREVAMTQHASVTADETWSLIRRDIDAAVADLAPQERDAILLRYFSGKSHIEIAADLAISEDASKKRLQRALESLRGLLTARGLAVPAAALAAALTTHAAAKAAPPAIAAALTHASLQTAASSTVLKGALTAAAKAKIAITAAALVALIGIPASLVVIHYTSSAPVETPPPAPAQAAAPAAVDAPAIATIPDDPLSDFFKRYHLPDGETLMYIPKPYMEGRALYWKTTRMAQTMPEPFGAIIFRSSNDQLTPWSLTKDFSLGSVFCTVCDISSQEIEGDKDLRSLLLLGDFVYRTDAPDETYLTALKKAAEKQTGKTLAITFRDVPRKVVILKGQWKDTPVSPTRPGIDIYGDQLAGNGGGGSGTSAEFGRSLSNWISQQVIIEGQNVPYSVNWRNNSGVPGAPETLAHDRDLVLKHIAEQTNLTWSEETRTVRRLFIEQSK